MFDVIIALIKLTVPCVVMLTAMMAGGYVVERICGDGNGEV